MSKGGMLARATVAPCCTNDRLITSQGNLEKFNNKAISFAGAKGNRAASHSCKLDIIHSGGVNQIIGQKFQPLGGTFYHFG
jgi:hypothetical protein